MSPAEGREISDAQLVAYIDGELSASERERLAEALSEDSETRQRLETLTRGGRAFTEAFDLLLEAAPDDKLQAMFADLVAGNSANSAAPSVSETVVPFRKRTAPERTPFWQMAAAAAVLALVFTGGLFAGGFFDPPAQVAEQKPGWREAAARYVALFSVETLAGMPTDPQARQENLQRVAGALGLDLSADKILNPDLAFQGTQLLQLEGKPLAQISYLYDGKTPVALCIIRTANPPAPPAEEKRHGMNVVHWVADGYGYMVIGDVPEPALQEISATFRARLS